MNTLETKNDEYIAYILSAEGKEKEELVQHLSNNGYTSHFIENGLLYVPQTEKYEVETILEDRFISFCKRGPIRQIDITKCDVRYCDELIIENEAINSTYELYFEWDKYFGWETRYHDGVWINFYTNWHPNGTITASYSVGGDLYFHENWELTDVEQEFFRNKMENHCQTLYGQSLLDFWKEQDPDYGHCNTCKHYTKCNICSYCNDGSHYEYLIH